MGKYYNWGELLSKDCNINFILGARGIGKTFGLRLQTIKDFLKNESQCMELTRYKADIDLMADGYHQRIEEFFPDYQFKSDKKGLYIANICSDDEKPDWKQYGFFGSLSEGYSLKRKTFSNKIKRIIFDEFVLDKNDKFHHYLKNERDTIATIISTATRERADGAGGKRAYVYFIANKVDRLCPYFEWFGINPDKYGFFYTLNKNVLVHNVPVEQDIYTGTIAEIIQGKSENALASAKNIATDKDLLQFISDAPKKKELQFFIKFEDTIFKIWTNPEFYFIEKTDKVLVNYPFFAPKIDDMRINTQGARELRYSMRNLRELLFMNLVKFDKIETYKNWLDFNNWLGT